MSFTAFPRLEQELARQVQEASLDHEAFETPLASCDLSRCRGMCCHDGVYLGDEERAVVRDLGLGLEKSEEVFEQRQGRWKTRTTSAGQNELGDGYPAHFPKTRCVFLDEQHYCRLQSKALREGEHPWYWKPFPCWLHPLTFGRDPFDSRRPQLTLPTVSRDPAQTEGYPGFASATTCGLAQPAGEPAWQVLEQELAFLSRISGRNLLRELGA